MLTIVGALLVISWIASVTKTKGFPYPESWIKALGLAVPTWIGATALFSLEVWHGIFLLVLAVNRHVSSAVSFFILFAGGFLAASLIWYLLLVFLYSLMLRLLWTDVPRLLRWLEPPTKKRDILFGWAVATLAVVVGAAPFLLSAFYSSELIIVTMQRRWRLTEAEAVGQMFSGWWVTAAYLYHIRSLLKARDRRRKKLSQRGLRG